MSKNLPASAKLLAILASKSQRQKTSPCHRQITCHPSRHTPTSTKPLFRVLSWVSWLKKVVFVGLVSGVGVGLEEDFYVCDAVACAFVGAENFGAVDEGVQALVWVAVEAGAGDDQEPFAVPDGSTDQAAVVAHFREV